MKHPYGAWPSPLSAERAALGGARFAGLSLSSTRKGETLVWWSVLDDGDTAVKVTRFPGGGQGRRIEAITSARTRVNEYGGGAFWTHGESIFWVEDTDQRIRRLDLCGETACLLDEEPHTEVGAQARAGSEALSVERTGPGHPLVPEPPAPRSTRYAAGVVEPGGAWMVLEREVHATPEGTPLERQVNDIVWLPTGLAAAHPTSSLPDGLHVLTDGADFSVSPVLSPDGRYLAWLEWNQPDMPWDATALMAAEVVVNPDGPRLTSVRRVAGSTGPVSRGPLLEDGAVSVCPPCWDPEGRLWWCDDREDLWFLCAAEEPGLPPEDSGQVVYRTDGEVGYPRWVSGGSRFGFAGGGVVAAVTVGGVDHVGVFGSPEQAPAMDQVLTPGWIDMLEAADISGPVVGSIAGSPDGPTAVVVAGHGRTESFGSTPWP
ncbi:MAG: hypothetical protein ACK5O2_01550, partial [Microthrixaceae bacterium]